MTLLDLCDTPPPPPLPDGPDYVARVARFMLASGGRWVSAIELEPVGGRQAWRTRLSEARRRYGFRTQNRVRWVYDSAGQPSYRLSEYRVVED